MTSPIEISAPADTAWCPGCGDFGILAAVKSALEALKKKPEEILATAGIGQAAKLPQYIRTNGMCGLHGRALPAATAAKLANPALTVLVNSGDGDCLGEGGNHFLHAIRRNPDLTLIMHNNQIYGLTKGQGSPTSDPGLKTSLQPRGVVVQPIKATALAFTLGCGFIARGFSGDVGGLSAILQAAISHRGFSFVEVLQPCISMNKVNTFAWYKSRYKAVNELIPGYDPADRTAAYRMCDLWGDTIPGGILYCAPSRPTLEDLLLEGMNGGPVEQVPREAAVLRALFDGFC